MFARIKNLFNKSFVSSQKNYNKSEVPDESKFMNLKSKFFAGVVGVSMVLSMVAIPASAQTTAELTAQINSLLAMIAQLQAQIGGQGQVPLGTVPQGSAVLFNTDLTVGSKGSDVTALQQWLVSKGHLQMPAGVAYGYFGNVTKMALAKYQAEAGISPAVGYFGPITRARVNAMATAPGSTTGTVSCPAGYTCTSTGGTTIPGSTGITTPGAEGTISASESSAGTVSTVYEGDDMAAILGIKLEATGSDMSVQRIKFDLDENVTASDTKFYNKIFSKLYVTEGGNVLASIDLNSSTVTKDGSDYFVTLSGFNLIIPKGSSKTVMIKADLYSAIDTADYNTETYTIAVAASGVRAVDGAGIDQYSGTTAIAATPTISADLTDSATLTLALNSSTPKKTDIVCTGGTSENECDKVTVLVFDLKAEKDLVKITDMNVAIAQTSTLLLSATASTTMYLYDGSTELANATVGAVNTAVFSDFDYTIPKDVTKTFTVKVDIRGASATRASFIASASSTGITDENSRGDSVTDSGTATGNSIGVLNVGPEFTLVSKSIVANDTPQKNGTTTNVSTSTMVATFNIKVKALGGALEFGISQATSSPFVSSSTGFAIYRDGSSDGTITSNSTSTSITFPSTCTTSGYTNGCSLAEGSEVTVPVSLQLQGRNAAGAAFTSSLYSVGIARLNWTPVGGAVTNTTFMSGEAEWRTSDVSFP